MRGKKSNGFFEMFYLQQRKRKKEINVHNGFHLFALKEVERVISFEIGKHLVIELIF